MSLQLQSYFSDRVSGKDPRLGQSEVPCMSSEGQEASRPRHRRALWMWSQPGSDPNILSLSPPERNKVNFLCHLDTRPGQSQATHGLAARLWFHCYYRGRWHPLCPCPLHCWRSEAFPASCHGRGEKWRMQWHAIWICFLCLNPLSLTKSSCTCLRGTPDNSSSSSAVSLFLSHHFYYWEMVSLVEQETSIFW